MWKIPDYDVICLVEFNICIDGGALITLNIAVKHSIIRLVYGSDWINTELIYERRINDSNPSHKARR